MIGLIESSVLTEALISAMTVHHILHLWALKISRSSHVKRFRVVQEPRSMHFQMIHYILSVGVHYRIWPGFSCFFFIALPFLICLSSARSHITRNARASNPRSSSSISCLAQSARAKGSCLILADISAGSSMFITGSSTLANISSYLTQWFSSYLAWAADCKVWKKGNLIPYHRELTSIVRIQVCQIWYFGQWLCSSV